MTAGALDQYLKAGAQTVVADRKRDFPDTAARLARWLSARLPQVAPVDVRGLRYPIGAGTSNETILFEARWTGAGGEVVRPLVARLHPGEFQMFLDPAFDRQVRLIRLIRDRGWLRVPEVLWDEPDERVLGRPFFVMEQVAGKVPVTFPAYNVSGFLVDATPRERERAWLSAMDQFTAIHRIPVGEVRFLHRREYGATGFEDEFNYWVAALDWTCGEHHPPALDAALDWLRSHMPSAPAEGVSWGDARMGNMIFGPDFEVRVVLDWEQASLAGGMQDLAWWLLFDDIMSRGIGVKRLEGLGTRDQTIALWQERTGLRAENLDWYQLYGAFKTGILATRKARLERRALIPGNNPGNSSATRWICEFLGRPAPADMA